MGPGLRQDDGCERDAGVPRETDRGRVEGWVLGRTFTVQSIPELRAFLLSQVPSLLLIATASASRIREAGTNRRCRIE